MISQCGKWCTDDYETDGTITVEHIGMAAYVCGLTGVVTLSEWPPNFGKANLLLGTIIDVDGHVATIRFRVP